jgi:hypothetical protein
MAFKISKYLQDLINQNLAKSIDNIGSEILEPASFSYVFPGSGSYSSGSGVMPSFDSTVTWKFNEPVTIKQGETLVIKPFDFSGVTSKVEPWPPLQPEVEPPKVEDDGVKRRIKRGGYTPR